MLNNSSCYICIELCLFTQWFNKQQRILKLSISLFASLMLSGLSQCQNKTHRINRKYFNVWVLDVDHQQHKKYKIFQWEHKCEFMDYFFEGFFLTQKNSNLHKRDQILWIIKRIRKYTGCPIALFNFIEL
jgi:hypothetical protein